MATRFTSHVERALRLSALGGVVDGRLRGTAPVLLAEDGDPAGPTPTGAPYEVFGPGDVERLASQAVTRRYPAPGTADAEETKLAHVEFSARDLAWRYTPARPGPNPVPQLGDTLRPWLVLVVGERAPNDVVVRRDGQVTLGPVALQAHPLDQSPRWAHVQSPSPGSDDQAVARIVSPRDLEPERAYVAVLVPAFRADGNQAWTVGDTTVTLPCYDRWTFRTGPQGDFPSLAAKLHGVQGAAITSPDGKPFGRAEIAYDHRAPVQPHRVVLQAAGALRLPPPDVEPPYAPPPASVTTDVAALTRRIVTPDGRGVVTAPTYPAPFTAPELTPSPPPPPTGGWVEQLRTDPALRGAAGLGAWNAIEWQDRISDAAAARAGDLTIARDRIRALALGVEASRSLWRRRVPASPVGRLAVLAPVLGRLVTDAGTTALDEVSGRTPTFSRALFSSAARRALRPGPARAGRATPGAGAFPAVLASAADCPRREPDPADLSRGGHPNDTQSAVKRAIYDAAGGDDALATAALNRLGAHPSPGLLAAAFDALAPGKDGRPDPDVWGRFVEGRREYPELPPDLPAWGREIDDLLPEDPCRPVDLGRLSDAVAGAVDPTVALPPAAKRVLAALPGITSLRPVEIEPEIDLPLWRFLADRAPDWMLPGAGDLPEHSAVALATNPEFVHALLTGANHQAAAELRWRNIPMRSRWSPLRRFWQRRDGTHDVVPIRTWPAVAPLGSPPLSDPGVGTEAVVAFRTPLFKRYPNTVVYLYRADVKPDGTWQTPDPNADLVAAKRVDPTFTGTIGTDITFFGFPVPPSALRTSWVVLEEPPAGYRFYTAAQSGLPPADPGEETGPTTGAGFAFAHFAQPVRVLIGPLLEDQP